MKNFQYSHFGPVGTELYSKHWSTPCRSCVGALSEKRKKEKKRKDTARTHRPLLWGSILLPLLLQDIDLCSEEEDVCWFMGMVGFDWGICRYGVFRCFVVGLLWVWLLGELVGRSIEERWVWGAGRGREGRAWILEKEKVEHRGRVLEKFYYVFFF